MEYIINGGKELQGEISLAGAKNVALKLIIAALLVKGKSTIENVPRIRDVMSLIDIINHLGGTVKFLDDHTITVENTLTKSEIPFEYGVRTRVSFMLIAPILFTFGKAKIPNPGGCRLGARPVDRLVNSVRDFGASVKYNPEDGFYYAELSQTNGGNITFNKKTHTGTELAIMMASRVSEKTTIHNAAQEPEIDDLIRFFNQGGAHIVRKGESIEIEGSAVLKPSVIKTQYDRNEAISLIVLSALFGGKIVIRNVELDTIQTFLEAFKLAGFNYSINDGLFRVMVPEVIKPVDIVTGPHPEFMTDWQPLWALLMTQAKGKSIIHETVFEDRFGYVEELKRFGAKLSFFQPEVTNPAEVYQFNWSAKEAKKQAIVISGPARLHNGVAKMTDIRAGACMLFAALLSKGKSLVEGVEQIERGYELLIDRLKKIGAEITPIES
ncbi:MAG: UDP-N-acetylglucosamine 1-carboxyvinyltransferase [Patescibacteria group bacterium]|jgi:UDP-N-acetylglucosamine 1-carboxyvinyltransferase